MKKKWISKMTLPVLAMLFVYYGTQHLGGSEQLNTVHSINEPTHMATMVNSDSHHVIYAMHESDYVVRTYAAIDSETSTINSIFNALTIEAGQLPMGVSSLVPEHAELINYSLEAGHLTLNLSKEFLEYDPIVEQNLVSSLVWSYTELEEIDRVSFMIEGQPVNNLNTPLAVGSGLSRAMGINLEIDSYRLNDTKLVMLYFLTDNTSNGFMIPVSRVVPNNTDPIAYKVNALANGPVGQQYISVFNHRVSLLEEPTMENGILILNFSPELFFDQAGTMVSSDMMRQLVMTMTALEEVESVSVLIDGDVRVLDDASNIISLPTSRSDFNSFIQAY
jgi:spore germination protein GerM